MVDAQQAFQAIAVVSLFVQSYLSSRIAFLRASRDAINFAYLALAAAPNTALWVTQHGRFGALHIPQPVCKHWLVPREPADKWLHTWVQAAADASRDRRRREGIIVFTATAVALSTFFFSTWVYSDQIILAVRECVFIIAVDAALIMLDPSPLWACVLQLVSRLFMVLPSMEVVLSHTIVALLVGLRLGQLAIADIIRFQMTYAVRYRFLQRLVCTNKRTSHNRFMKHTTCARLLAVLFVAALPGIQAAYDAYRRFSADTCECDFESGMFNYEFCIPDAAGEKWCYVNRNPSRWGWCASHPVGFNATEWPNYGGENLCPLLGGAARDERFWMDLWCLAPWQHKVAAALLPAFILGLLLYAVVRQLRRSKLRVTCGLCVNLVVIYALSAVLIWIWPELDCYNHRWSPWWLRLTRLTTTILGICCGAAFYRRWRIESFAKPSLVTTALWMSSIILILLGSPVAKYENFTNGVSEEDYIDICTIAVVIELACALISWRGYFSSDFRMPAFGWASLGLALVVHILCGVYLLIYFPSQDTISVVGNTIKESTLNFTILVIGGPFLFFVALKGRQYVKCTAARDGCEEKEKQHYDDLRRRCTWQLVVLFVPIGLLAVPVALTANSFVFNIVAWLMLAHLGVGLFQYEYLFSSKQYPLILRIAWASLYVVCLVCAVLLGVKRCIRSGLLAGGVATELHLLAMALATQRRASPVQVRLLQGWFSHGLRSIFYCYDAAHDQLRFLWHPCAAFLASVIIGCVWNLGAIGFWINLDVCIAMVLIRLIVVGLWKLRCGQVCDIPNWAAAAKTTWVLEEGVRVWDCVHPEPDSDLLHHFQSLLEHSAQFAIQLESEAASGCKNKQSVAAEKGRLLQAVQCGLLEWEFRFGVRLEAEMERMSSMLPGVASSIGLDAHTTQEIFDLPDESWNKLLNEISAYSERAKKNRKVEQQLGEQRDAARRERDRIREQSERRRSSVEPGVQPPIGQGGKSNSEEELHKHRSWWKEELRNHEQRGCGSFTDAEFPANARSLGSVASRLSSASWVRLTELYAGNHMILRGTKYLGQLVPNNSLGVGFQTPEFPSSLRSTAGEELAGDITQGSLGDCWLLSAMAVLCTRPLLLERVFLDSPDVNACGAYCFRLFQRGRTRRVIVDDCIPASRNGHTVQPVFARPHFGKEGLVMWPLLLEKAFAKLYGSYGAIEAGLVHEALMDLTGGLGEMIMFGGSSGVPANLWARLVQCKKSGHLLAAGSRAGSDSNTSPRGIVQGHAYSILSVREIGGLRLLKLRNPWGRCEWTGDFSDNSRRWTPELKASLRWTAADDGMFWMQFSDFLCEFECIFICRVFPVAQFERQALSGKWAQGRQEVFSLHVRSGGSVCMQLEQTDVRGTGQSQNSAIRLEVRPSKQRQQPDRDAPFGVSPFQHFAPVDRSCISSTPLTMGREVALEVNLNEGQHEVAAILQSQSMMANAKEFTLTVFSSRQMSVQISAQTPVQQPSADPRGRVSTRGSTNSGRQQTPAHPPHWGMPEFGHSNSLERSVEMTQKSNFAPSDNRLMPNPGPPQMIQSPRHRGTTWSDMPKPGLQPSQHFATRDMTHFDYRPMPQPGATQMVQSPRQRGTTWSDMPNPGLPLMMQNSNVAPSPQFTTRDAFAVDYRQTPHPGPPLNWQQPTPIPLTDHLDRAVQMAGRSDFGIDGRRQGMLDRGLQQPFIP